VYEVDCDAMSFGGGTHLQMQRSSLRAAWRPSGPVIEWRGPSHLITPTEPQAGHMTGSFS
jgi:hypothetical protein